MNFEFVAGLFAQQDAVSVNFEEDGITFAAESVSYAIIILLYTE